MFRRWRMHRVRHGAHSQRQRRTERRARHHGERQRRAVVAAAAVAGRRRRCRSGRRTGRSGHRRPTARGDDAVRVDAVFVGLVGLEKVFVAKLFVAQFAISFVVEDADASADDRSSTHPSPLMTGGWRIAGREKWEEERMGRSGRRNERGRAA